MLSCDLVTLAFRDVLAYKRLYEVAFFKTAYGISGVDLDELADKLEKRDEADKDAIPDMSKRVKEMENEEKLTSKRALESKTQEGRLDPRTVTRNDVKDLLEKVQRGEIFGNHYIPLRIGTPAILIEKAKEKRNDIIDNNPIAMSADKAYQAMAQKRLGPNNRPHKLTVTDMISIIEAMSDPQYIVYQSSNERYVEVVEYNTAEKKKAVAVLEIGEYKPHWTTTGYEEGLYNLLVTTFPPDSGKITELLDNKNNVIIYDKKKDASRGTPGSMVPSVSNDPSFFEESIPQPEEKVNPKTTKKSLPAKDVAERDRAYMDAVNRGDMETAQRMVYEAARAMMSESKIKTKDGKLRKVYHGTNSGDFTEFNPDYIGMSSGDDGFFGMGFYFAYSRGEAAYYGASRIIEAYLNIENPFDFRKELQMYKGKRAESGHAPDAVAMMNFADKFPDIAKNIKLGVVKASESEYTDISLAEFSKAFKDVIENKEFEYTEVKNEFGETETVVTADEKTYEYEYQGEKHSYKDYGFNQRFWGTANAIDVAYEYLATAVYRTIDMIPRTRLILDHNREFTAKLKEMGYDGTIQSEQGDEAVAFYPEQVKSADPVTYDDEGKAIPLSKRFDVKRRDIRYSLPPKEAEMEKAKFLARAAVYRADGTVQELDEDILTFLDKLGLTV